MKSVMAEIESQLDQLTPDEQLLLIEKLAKRLRRKDDKDWERDLAALAADPDIQRELREIEQEFAGNEMNGLEKAG